MSQVGRAPDVPDMRSPQSPEPVGQRCAFARPTTVPSWKAHPLTGDRKGAWSLFVTKNWRITFRIDQAELEIIDLDYEDYH